MKERRRFKRFLIEGMDVHCRMLFATEVKILNISFGGAALRMDRRLNIGEEYTLKIESTENSVSLKGVVVWERMTGPTKKARGKKLPAYEAGIRFSDVLTEKGADLIAFIRENIPDEAIKTRIQGLRVNVIRPEKTVILDDRESYYVKMIGLGGILIETKEELNVESRFPLEITFPEDKKPIRVLGRTAYCMEIPGKIPKRYDTGIEFIEMNETDRARLKEFIDILQAI